jgi:hypothetical protein
LFATQNRCATCKSVTLLSDRDSADNVLVTDLLCRDYSKINGTYVHKVIASEAAQLFKTSELLEEFGSTRQEHIFNFFIGWIAKNYGNLYVYLTFENYSTEKSLRVHDDLITSSCQILFLRGRRANE